MIRTSQTHPLRIDAVEVGTRGGLLGITFCPGKKQPDGLTGQWHRDLDLDVAALSRWGCRLLLTLVEDHELRELQVEGLPDVVQRAGIDWRWLPTPDGSAPGDLTPWRPVLDRMRALLTEGARVAVHCKGGLGRAGTAAAMILIEEGVSPVDAMARVRAARHGAIETAAQERFLLAYPPR